VNNTDQLVYDDSYFDDDEMTTEEGVGKRKP
jgi:hypothetical protein